MEFLCALDLPDTLPLNPDSAIRIEGWVVEVDGATIDEVRVEYGKSRTAAARYPSHRPDVAAYYPRIPGAAASGFITDEIRPEAWKDHALDLRVVVVCGGETREVHARSLRLQWRDPAAEMFMGGRVGPFKHPDSFDETRWPTHPEVSPRFVIDDTPALEGRGLADASPFAALLQALVDCHDAWAEHLRLRLADIESHRGLWAIGTFDIHGVLAAMVDAVHAEVFPRAAPDAAFALAGREMVALVPLLARVYPEARFEYVLSSEGPESKARMPGDMDPRYAQPWGGDRVEERMVAILAREAGEARFMAVRRAPDAPRSGPAERSWFRPPVAGEDGLRFVRPHAETQPVFVLGAGRSGTSAMVGAMTAAGYVGWHEGHVFPLLERLLRAVAQAAPPAGGRDLRETLVPALVRATLEPAYGPHGDQPWLDKTPDHPMIECVPVVRAAFPNARFIAMRRHPISFAESRQRKFGEAPLSAINEWVKCDDAWEAQRAAVPEGVRIDCDADALGKPGQREAVMDFLALDADARKRFVDYLSSERAELTRVPPSVMQSLEELPPARRYEARRFFFELLDAYGVFLEDTAWPDADKVAVERLLAGRAERHGYRLRRHRDEMAWMMMSWARRLEDVQREGNEAREEARILREASQRAGGGN